MEKIKFRGYGIEQKKWFYGSLVIDKNGNHAISDDYGTFYDVFDDSVGQYIGVEDYKGNPIYNGDILSCTGRGKTFFAYIKFISAGFRLVQVGFDYKYTPHVLHESDVWMWEITIAGNVYENPNLINP